MTNIHMLHLYINCSHESFSIIW